MADNNQNVSYSTPPRFVEIGYTTPLVFACPFVISLSWYGMQGTNNGMDAGQANKNLFWRPGMMIA